MNVWIVNPYGELPSEGWREYRSSMLAKALAQRGHKVTWWISDFVHRSKKYRSRGLILDPLLPSNIRVVSVHTSPYKKNISWQRIRYEVNYGREFYRLAQQEEHADIIVLADPSLFYSKHVLEYKKANKCKVVLDVIDLWPELFEIMLPRPLQPFSHFVLRPLYRRRYKLIRNCDAIVAVCKDYLHTALINQKVNKPCLVSYLGIENKESNNNQTLSKELCRFAKGFKLIAVYAGTLGDAYDMNLIINSINYAASKNLPIGYIVAGEGPRHMDFVKLAHQKGTHLKYLGRLDSEDMPILYANSDVGLMSYVPQSTVSMPVKFYDYMAGGLAILNSLGRDAGEIVEKYNIGFNYDPSDLEDFSQKLCILMQDEKLLKSFKDNSKETASHYNSLIQHENYAIFLERI